MMAVLQQLCCNFLNRSYARYRFRTATLKIACELMANLLAATTRSWRFANATVVHDHRCHRFC